MGSFGSLPFVIFTDMVGFFTPLIPSPKKGIIIANPSLSYDARCLVTGARKRIMALRLEYLGRGMSRCSDTVTELFLHFFSCISFLVLYNIFVKAIRAAVLALTITIMCVNNMVS